MGKVLMFSSNSSATCPLASLCFMRHGGVGFSSSPTRSRFRTCSLPFSGSSCSNWVLSHLGPSQTSLSISNGSSSMCRCHTRTRSFPCLLPTPLLHASCPQEVPSRRGSSPEQLDPTVAALHKSFRRETHCRVLCSICEPSSVKHSTAWCHREGKHSWGPSTRSTVVSKQPPHHCQVSQRPRHQQYQHCHLSKGSVAAASCS